MALMPGQTHEEIEARLSIVSLDSKPRYEALSYVWGDPNVARTILLNGHTFRITENLEAALRRLRRLQEERIFWVDAICVNQQDLSERKFQVSLMVDIYTGCRCCTVWLGEEEATTEKAMHLIQSMASDSHVQTWTCFLREYRASLEAHQGSKNDLKAFLQSNGGIFKPLEHLFQKSWWSRSWTVQELILPRLAVIKCGRHEINWPTISQAYGSLEIHLYRCCKHFHDSLPTEDHYALDSFDDAVSALTVSWSNYQDQSEEPDTISLLAQNRNRDASDPRDKVYAFLSLCTSDVRERLAADYSTDLLDCYAWPTIDDIQKSRNLRSLGLALQNETNLHLPSWVPDWSTCPEELSAQADRLFRLYDLFDAASGSAALFSRQSRTLSLWGIHRATISIIGDPAEYGLGDENISVLQSWFDLWQSTYKQTPRADRKNASAIPFLRTLMLDTFCTFEQLEYHPSFFKDPTRAKPEDYEACKRWWALACAENTFEPHFEIEPGPEAELKDYVRQNLDYSIAYQRFFITEGGAIGLGPTATKVGDEIWIVCGGRMPLVLRHSEKISPSWEVPHSQSCHTLVGNCYVDGFMEGEAVDGLMNDSVVKRN